jgi:putative FmdB family regulatory protein
MVTATVEDSFYRCPAVSLLGMTMPMYRFYCEQCGELFEERMSPPEHDQNQAECPRCHSDARVHGATDSDERRA